MGKDNQQSKDRPIWQRIKKSIFQGGKAMNRQEMIDELLEDDMNGVASMSMGENDDLIRDMLLNGRRGYNNYTDEELNEEYKRYLEMQNEEEDDE
jgi:hypothetical protein